MNNIFLAPTVVESLGWTIVHSLWQATLLAGILWLLSRAIASARLRYRLAYGTLLAQLAVSIATFVYLYEPEAADVAMGEFSLTIFVTESASGGWSSRQVLPLVVLAWFIAFGLGLLRLGWSFGRVRRMRWKANEAVSVEFSLRVRLLAERIGYVGKIRLALSRHVDGPALVGHLKPLLLFPVALLNQLTPDEAEAVILHELAHLQRKDHWWNLLQCLIEVIFQYHPMIWWIGARIREEREHCCDDIVLTYGPGGLPYAKALLYFETQRSTPATAIALTNSPGGLLGRVQRFLHQQNIPYQMKSRLFLLPILALIALVGTAAYAPTSAEAELPSLEAKTELPCPAPLTSIAPATAPRIAPAAVDTLPRGRHKVSSHRNGKSTEFLVEDGKIQSLTIDGKVIPESEFDEHEPMVEQMLSPRGSFREVPMLDRMMRSGDVIELDLNIHDDELIKLERTFDNLGNSFEFRFEDLGERFEQLGLRFEDIGERIGEQFEGTFRFEDIDGQSFFFHSDSIPHGRAPFYFADSISMDGNRVILRGNARFFDENGIDISSERIDFDRDGLRTEQDKIREMERMIERMEREKERLQRDLERQQADQERQLSDQERQLRDAERLARDEERGLQDEQRELLREQRENLRAEQELVRSQRERNAIDYESVVTQLRSEGLIPDKDVSKFTLDNDQLKVNGKKTSAAAHARMLEIINQRYGNNFGQSFKVDYNSRQ